MVQLHLFIVEGQGESHGAQDVPAQTQSQNPPQGEAQTHPVVPDMVKMNRVIMVFRSNNVLMCVKQLILRQFR